MIDLVTRSQDGRQYELVLVVDSGEWRIKGALHALQKKINDYTSYALDGAMTADDPDSAGPKKAIVTRPSTPPWMELSPNIQLTAPSSSQTPPLASIQADVSCRRT